MYKLRILCRVCSTILLGAIIVLLPILVKTKPLGAQIESGAISIGSDAAKGIDTLVTQQSQKGIINWQSFSIGTTEHTHFAQPGASSVTLNRVTGGDLSAILGQLSATGKIFLINPSGIFFGPSARIDVAGLIASTANISSANFLAGNYAFMQGPNNVKITNQGYIKIADNGVVYMVAPGVENTGVIEAKLGKVVLGATPTNSSYVLDFYGDQLLQFALPQETGLSIDNAINQSGKIIAPGGRVLLSANSANSVVNNVINMSGVIEANTIENTGGEIVLSGGEKGIVSVTGNISARGNLLGEYGGLVKITGEKVGLFDNAMIDVSGMAGGGKVLIGADYLNNNIISAAKAVYVGPTASIIADAIKSGSGGEIRVLSDESTRFYGSASAKGGAEGGNGGFIETSGNWLDVEGAKIDTSAPSGIAGLWLLDPYNVTISTSANSNGGFGGSNPIIWTPTGSPSNVNVTSLLTQLGLSNVRITTTGAGSDPGNINFNAALNYSGVSVRDLNLIAANDININAAITSATNNLTLTLSAGRDININNSGTNVLGLTTTASRNTNINTTTIATTGTNAFQLYNTPVVLASSTSVVLTATGGTTPNIQFNDTINGFDFDTSSLTVNAKNITFGGAIGTTNELLALTVNASGTTRIGTTGGVTIKTLGAQQYSGAVTLGADTVLNAAANNISFSSTINSFDATPRALTFNTSFSPGSTTFNGAIGSINPLSALTFVSGGTIFLNATSVTTTGTQSYSRPVILGASPVLTSTASGNLSFSSTLNSDAPGTRSLTLNTLGDTIFSVGGVGFVKPLSTIIFGGAGGTIFISGGGITTTNAQSYPKPVVLGASTTLTAPSISFSSTLDSDSTPRALILNNTSGDITFSGVVGAAPLASLTTGTVGTTNINGGSITTTGSQLYQNQVVFSGDTILTTTGATGDISFNNTVNGNAVGLDLTISSGRNVTFSNTVGATNALGLLTVTAPGTITLGGGTVTALGAQQYNGPVLLSVDTTLSANSIIFANTVDSLPTSFLDIEAGNVTFGGAVGAANALDYLIANTIGPTTINGGIITTNSTQQYNGPVILGGTNTVLNASGISFTKTIDSASGSPRSLDIEAGAGGVTFGASIGGIRPLQNLTTNTGGTTTIRGVFVTTRGAQSYSDPVILNGNVIFNASSVFFGDTLNSDATPRSVLISASGNIIFSGLVGGFNNFSTSGSGTTYINIGAVTTSGAQNYFNAVILGSDVTINASNVNFANALNSDSITRTLTLNVPGNVTFGGAVGSNNALSTIIFNNPGAISINGAGASITTTGSQSYPIPVTLGADAILTAGNSIIFNSTISGPHILTLNTGSVTGDVNLGSLYLNVSFANLTGLVAGDATKGALINNFIRILNVIGPGTHFFNGIDLYVPIPTTIINTSQIQTALDIAQYNYNTGFDYQSTDTEQDKDNYLLLVNPLQCVVEGAS